MGHRGEDFVFYSIFEWQDRKGPNEMIEAFLRPFPLSLRGACAQVEPRRGRGRRGNARRPSPESEIGARIEMRCEAWSEQKWPRCSSGETATFHSTGAKDGIFRSSRPPAAAKRSLRPVFRARGVFGRGSASLVRHRPASVRQRYAFYLPPMQWAEPEMEHAVELLRAVFHERRPGPVARGGESRAISQDVQLRIDRHSARQRYQLLRRTNPAKWERIDAAERQCGLMTPAPIPGDW